MRGLRILLILVAALAVGFLEPRQAGALDPQHQESPSDCLGPADPFCASSGTGGSGGTSSCTATSKCYSGGMEVGSVSCTGKTCSRGTGWVKCDGNTTYCGT